MSTGGTRQDRSRRARRSLLWCAVLLVVSPWPGSWLIDRCPLHIRFPLAAAIISSWERAAPAPNILILGSSRMGSFLHSSELNALTNKLSGKDSAHAFNGTIMGGEPITMEFMARQLLARAHPAPRLVIVETNADLLPRDNLYFKLVISRQLTARDFRQYLGDIVFCHDALPRVFSSRVTPFYLHRGQFLAMAEESVRRKLPPGKLEADEKAPGTLNVYGREQREKDKPPHEERLRIALRRFQEHLQNYQLEGSTSDAFERMVALLHERGCEVLLVQTPLSAAQRALFSPDMRAQFDAFIKRLETNYGCQFLDYSARLPDALLDDNHHANDRGTAEFVRLLSEEAVAPLWRSLQTQPAE